MRLSYSEICIVDDELPLFQWRVICFLSLAPHLNSTLRCWRLCGTNPYESFPHIVTIQKGDISWITHLCPPLIVEDFGLAAYLTYLRYFSGNQRTCEDMQYLDMRRCSLQRSRFLKKNIVCQKSMYIITSYEKFPLQCTCAKTLCSI